MKVKIDKKGFFQLIGVKENTEITSLAHTDVSEFKLNKKFAYALSKLHPFQKLQKNLISNFLSHIPLNSCATAYRKEYSYLNFLEPHVGNFHFLRLDIKNFFHSINRDTIAERFKEYFKDEYVDEEKKTKLIDIFTDLITLKIDDNFSNTRYVNSSILPMGFKTSPIVSNIVFRKLDILIEKLCAAKNISYTRYADDMLFSSSIESKIVHSEFFQKEIALLLNKDHFKLNIHKTLKATHTISINGYVIEYNFEEQNLNSLRISNKKTDLYFKILHEIEKGSSHVKILKKFYDFKITNKVFPFCPPTPDFHKKYCEDQLLNKLRGIRSYVISLVKFNDSHKCIDHKALKKYDQLISSLDTHIEKIGKAIPP